MKCLHCGAMNTNGLALCDLSQRYAADLLEHLPIHFRNLARQRRPGRPNGSVGGVGGRSFGEGGSASVVAALGRVEADVSGWAKALADDRVLDIPEGDTEVETFTLICQWFIERLTTIATLEWAGEFVGQIERAEKSLRRVTETTMPGWYAGACRQPTGRDMEGNEHTCGADIHVMPGLTWVTCRRCGTTTHAADHLPAILEEASDWTARPKLLAEALVALTTEQSVVRLYERIKKWEQRGKVVGRRRVDAEGDEVGPKKYRLGDVLELLEKEGETRSSAVERKAS